MINLSTSSPLSVAVAAMDRRTPVGSAMKSCEWETVPAEVRDRAFWISSIEDQRILVEAKQRLQQVINQQRDSEADGGRVMERGRFVQEMQGVLKSLGYQPDPAKRGTLQDVSSSARLSLIYRMNLDMAQGHANWKARQNEVSLRRAPALELIRAEARIERRDWPSIWAKHGGKFYGEPGPDYPMAPGRMIAKVNDDIWKRISRFGLPWAPFDWGSGMNVRVVRRRRALALGVISEDEELQPSDLPFNQGLTASVKGWPEAPRQRLKQMWGDGVEIDKDEVRYVRDLTPANPHRHKTITEEMRDRAAGFVSDWISDLPDLDDVLERLASVVTGQRESVTLLLDSAKARRVRKALRRSGLAFDWDGKSGQLTARREGGRP